MTTLLFTIQVSASYQGTREVYSAQVLAPNGQKLYRLTEAHSVSQAVEQVAKQMQQQERHHSL